MHEVAGSIPAFSMAFFFYFLLHFTFCVFSFALALAFTFDLVFAFTLSSLPLSNPTRSHIVIWCDVAGCATPPPCSSICVVHLLLSHIHTYIYLDILLHRFRGNILSLTILFHSDCIFSSNGHEKVRVVNSIVSMISPIVVMRSRHWGPTNN